MQNERMKRMIAVNKSEKEIISKRAPSAHIVRTMNQNSKRHHYYCEESGQVMQILSELRGSTDNQKVGAEHGHREKK